MNHLLRELDEAVEELVTHTRALAWSIDPHGETTDTLTVEAAADHLAERLEHSADL